MARDIDAVPDRTRRDEAQQEARGAESHRRHAGGACVRGVREGRA